jgi:hypothetical protein
MEWYSQFMIGSSSNFSLITDSLDSQGTRAREPFIHTAAHKSHNNLPARAAVSTRRERPTVFSSENPQFRKKTDRVKLCLEK